MTFACIIRLMPATPIAESSAPIVVGIRHTSSATSVVTVTALPALATSTLKIDIGSRSDDDHQEDDASARPARY